MCRRKLNRRTIILRSKLLLVNGEHDGEIAMRGVIFRTKGTGRWIDPRRVPQVRVLNTRKLFIYSKHSWLTTIDRFHSRGQQLYKFLGTKVKFLHPTRVQATKEFFGTPTWPPFHCFVHQYGRRNVIWKRSTFKFVLSEFWTIQRRRRIPPITSTILPTIFTLSANKIL